MSTNTELSSTDKKSMIGKSATITVNVTAFHERGRLVRVEVPGGRFVLVPVEALGGVA